MDISAKRVLNNLYYYTVALFVLVFSVLFMVRMAGLALASYQMVVYYIWTAIAIVLVIADVIATMMNNRYKYLISLCIYGLMVLAVIVGFIVYAAMQVGGVIPAGSLGMFNTLIFFSLGLTVGLIVVNSLGYKVVELNESEEEI